MRILLPLGLCVFGGLPSYAAPSEVQVYLPELISRDSVGQYDASHPPSSGSEPLSDLRGPLVLQKGVAPPHRAESSGFDALVRLVPRDLKEVATFIKSIRDPLCEAVKPGSFNISIGIESNKLVASVSGGLSVTIECK